LAVLIPEERNVEKKEVNREKGYGKKHQEN
jgi:hypothetical protein